MPKFEDHKELETCIDCPYLVKPTKNGESQRYPALRESYVCELTLYLTSGSFGGETLCGKDEIPTRSMLRMFSFQRQEHVRPCEELTRNIHDKMAEACNGEGGDIEPCEKCKGTRRTLEGDKE